MEMDEMMKKYAESLNVMLNSAKSPQDAVDAWIKMVGQMHRDLAKEEINECLRKIGLELVSFDCDYSYEVAEISSTYN